VNTLDEHLVELRAKLALIVKPIPRTGIACNAVWYDDGDLDGVQVYAALPCYSSRIERAAPGDRLPWDWVYGFPGTPSHVRIFPADAAKVTT
jgi:hypothetical protein